MSSYGSCTDDNDGALDKQATSYNDIFDAFRLALSSTTFKRELIIE
jgi:hypothetical protein